MKIETAKIYGEMVGVVNVSQTVGFKAVNQTGDLLLIQGLFNYIAKGLTPETIGLGGEYKIPQISGVMDNDTSSAIAQFQITQAASLLRQYFDGRIDPAHYKHRAITRYGARYMTITQLHFLATDASVMLANGIDGYIQGLASLNAQLANVIDQAIMNS